MSVPEIGYRVQQFIQKKREKKGTTNLEHAQSYKHILVASYNSILEIIPWPFTQEFIGYNNFQFFGYSINIEEEIDWHLDISSSKKFPLSFSKDIDIRSDKFGSAKVVWEINRLQFLLPLAVEYSALKDKTKLHHWMHLVTSWVNGNPYLRGVNWYSNIEINIRLIVWYHCWQILWQCEELKNDNEFLSFAEEVWLPSIYEHCVYSYNNPSKYSSANNHLIAEYSGLFIASCCWQFKEADEWRLYALKGLEKEIQLQYSSSGINKEEAAEYIQFITDFFLIAYSVGQKHGVIFSKNYERRLKSIAEYITNLLDCNKNYRKYGDEDDGKVLVTSNNPHFDNFSSILTSAAVIFNSEKFKLPGNSFDFKNWLLWGEKGKSKFENLKNTSSNLTSKFYKDEGHFIFRKITPAKDCREIYMHFDAAPLGFLTIAAHGHADALSFVLTIDGYPIIVDVGTYTYHTDKKWRNYFVSTLAHNTICIDETNQAYQAGPTMWLNHYKTFVLNIEQSQYMETVSAFHSGYKKIGCTHTRTINFDRVNDVFNISDQIETSSKKHVIIQPLHLHPDVEIENIDTHEFFLKNTKGGRRVKIKYDERLQINVVRGQFEPILGWYSKSFLAKEPTSVIIGKLQTNHLHKTLLNTKIEIVN
jgi:hypothetical protein